MVLKINPYQPYQVKVIPPLASLQLQSLTQLYQPIMGGQALSLYLTLANQTVDHKEWTFRQVHAWLLPIINMGIQTFNEARIRLEGVGLVKTYRDQESHDSYQRQTIIYVLQSPLMVEDFFKDPHLSNALYHQIGDEAFYKLNQQWKKEVIDQEQYIEITQPFSSVFDHKSLKHHQDDVAHATEGLSYKEQFARLDLTDSKGTSHFDQKLYRQILLTNGFDESLLNKLVLQQVGSLSQFYELDEQAMAQLTQLAQNPISNQIDLDVLRDYAQKNQYYTKQRNHKDTQKKQDEYLEKEKLQSLYPDLSKEEIDLILICQDLDPQAFLSRMKAASNGFVTSSESFYLRDLRQQSTLNDDVINMLIYYLIGLEKQANFERGWSNRVANQWQQAGIKDAGEALDFLIRQKKVKEQSHQQRSKKQASWKKYSEKRQESLPSWMNDEGQEDEATTQIQPTDPDSVHAMRQRLKALMNKEESTHEDYRPGDK